MMPGKVRFCVLCNRQNRARRSVYTRIKTVEREAKILEGYRRRHNGRELNQSMINQEVHRSCYTRTVQGLPSVCAPLQHQLSVDTCDQNELASMTDNLEKKDDDVNSECGDDEEQQLNQSSLIQFRSRMPPPSNLSKRQFQRRQRVCILCNRYAYKSYNKMKQIISNYMADKLAQGFFRLYKRPIGYSLLDAHMHEVCIRKLYSSYRYNAMKKPTTSSTPRVPQYATNFRSSVSPHGTRSRTTIASSSFRPEPRQFARIMPKSTTEVADVPIQQFLATPLYTSVATTNPNAELSARSCLFRPCLPRLTPEEIELYTKRDSMPVYTIVKCDQFGADELPVVQPPIVADSLPIFRTLPSTTNGFTMTRNNLMNYSNNLDNRDDEDDNEHTVEHDTSPDWTPEPLPRSRVGFITQQKLSTAATIRRRYLKPPPLAKPTVPIRFDTYDQSTHDAILSTIVDDETRPLSNLQQLQVWLIDQLKSSGKPMSMGDVQIQFKLIVNNKNGEDPTRESSQRDRLRARLEKYYPNKFIFITPNKREGTFVALNDIDHYVRHAIKTVKEEKDKILVPTPVVAPPPSVPSPRDTCETIMNAVRKLRIYLRDPKQTDSIPHVLIRNFIGLLTTSERQFDKLTHQYDFYRMIDDDLFLVPTNTDNSTKTSSSKLDKTVRNMSLASDLISARHDHRISAKHFLLADELMKKNFHCTPRQVMTLLNRYGHTCSYKSYTRMKALQVQTLNFGEVTVINSSKTTTTTTTDGATNEKDNDGSSSDSDLDLMQL